MARLGSSPRNDDFAKAARTLPCGSLVGASHCLNIHPATPISGMNLVSGLEASPDAFGIVVGLIAGELSGVVVHPLAPPCTWKGCGNPMCFVVAHTMHPRRGHHDFPWPVGAVGTGVPLCPAPGAIAQHH